MADILDHQGEGGYWNPHFSERVEAFFFRLRVRMLEGMRNQNGMDGCKKGKIFSQITLFLG